MLPQVHHDSLTPDPADSRDRESHALYFTVHNSLHNIEVVGFTASYFLKFQRHDLNQ